MRDESNIRFPSDRRALGSDTDPVTWAAGPSWGPSDDAAPETFVSAPLTIHRLLRGRYGWVALFIVLGVVTGALLGYVSGHKVFRSTAQIRIVSVLPQVLYKDDEKNIVPVYEAFAEAQTQLILSQRVIKAAMTSPAWQALGRATDEGAVGQFQSSLLAERKLEIISVHMDDPTPEGAVAGVTSVIRAYQHIYENDDRENREHRIELLEKHKSALATQLRSVRERQSTMSSALQADDLQAIYDAKLRTVRAMDAMRPASGVKPTTNSEDVDALPGESSNPSLAERSRLRWRISELRAAGLGENHPQIAALQGLAAKLDDMLDTRSSQTVSGGYKQAEKELVEISDRLKRVSDLRAEEDALKQQSGETGRRINQLQVEDDLNNRIVVMAEGEKPLGPFRDTRKTFAAAGVFGGGLLGFGMAACFCLIDRRFRDPRDLALASHHNPVIATIPRLPVEQNDGKRPDGKAAEAERARRAALAVHQMRMLLHARGGRGPQTLAVTSAGAGSGKTSVTLALGVSFASAGSNTLLIDLDLVGAGLTSTAEAVRPQPLGRLMLRQGLLSEHQLAEAEAARLPGRLFGEACVQLGMVSHEDVSDALAAQSGTRVGVMEALAGQPLEECVTQTGVPRLSILPLGGATPEHAASLSLPVLTRLIEEARRQYDVVIVDTGPLLGSLEASVVCNAVDGTVLVVSRGEERSRARKGKEMLQSLRASLAGLVFNRAEPQDLSPISTSGSLSGLPKTEPKVQTNGWIGLSRLGPVALAVGRYVPGDAEASTFKSSRKPSGMPSENGVSAS